MRALLFCLAGLITAAPEYVLAEAKAAPKAAAPASEVRYFTAIDGLLDGNADVVLKETRQGKAVSAAVLDVCYTADKSSDRKDRFVVNLAVNGQTLSGTSQSVTDKQPVTVKLTRKPTGDNFDFRGQITIGPTVTEVASTDNSDISEKEFQDSQTTDDGITASPKDFSEVSPEAVAVKIKLDAVTDFVKSLKGQHVEVSLNSLVASCDALRSGEQVINIGVDPDRAATFIAQAKSAAGVVAAGWTSGVVDMDRTIRFPAADWRDGDKVNREKLASAIARVLTGSLPARSLTSSKWSEDTGKLKLVFKRPSKILPALELTDTIEVVALVAADKPAGSDSLILWVSAPSVTTADEYAGPKLNLSDESASDEEAEPRDDTGSIDALAKELKGQRWDADNSVWK
jgi:hypothetical protein